MSRVKMLVGMCGLVGMAGFGGVASAAGELDHSWGLGWNTGGPWRPTLVSTKPVELDGPFVKTWDQITGESAEALMPPPAMVAACFDPSKPPSEAVMAKLEAAMRQAVDESGLKYQVGGRWSGNYVGADGVTRSYGASGDPIVMTWSLVPDGVSISSGVGEPVANSNIFARMDSAFASQGGRATWISRIQQTFDRWGQYIGVTYVRISGNVNNSDADDGAVWTASGNALRGQVRISMKSIDGQGGVLAYNQFPGSGTGGNMVLDSDDAVRANFASTSGSNLFFRNVVAHEHGHGLGLSHVCPVQSSKLMEPFISTAYDGQRQDDILGGMANYGDSSESDNTLATAKDRGSVGVNAAAVTLGTPPAPVNGFTDANSSTLSIHRSADVDFHKITPSAGVLLSATLTPVGSSYQAGAQTQACDTGTSLNSLDDANLSFEIQDAAGTAIFTANTAAAALPENLTNVLLSPGVPYYFRVSGTSLTAVQQYKLAYSTSATAPTITASDGLRTGIDVSWTAIPGATQYSLYRNSVDSETGATLVVTQVGTSYSDVSQVPSDDVFYFVRAVQGNGAARTFGASDAGWVRCTADIEGTDRGVDFGDFLAFFNCYDVEGSCADIDGNPGVDFGDFLTFFNGYDAGC
jgi:hypothetical protein